MTRNPSLLFLVMSILLSIVTIATIGKLLFSNWTGAFSVSVSYAFLYSAVLVAVSKLFEVAGGSNQIFGKYRMTNPALRGLYALFQNKAAVGGLIILIELLFIYKPLLSKVDFTNDQLLQEKMDELSKAKASVDPDVQILKASLRQEAWDVLILKGVLIDKSKILWIVIAHMVFLLIMAVLSHSYTQKQRFFLLKEKVFLGGEIKVFDGKLALPIKAELTSYEVAKHLSALFVDDKDFDIIRRGDILLVVLSDLLATQLGVNISILTKLQQAHDTEKGV